MKSVTSILLDGTVKANLAFWADMERGIVRFWHRHVTSETVDAATSTRRPMRAIVAGYS